MGYFLSFILTIFLLANGLIYRSEPHSVIETFELRGDNILCVSIEHYRGKSGWVPVVLSFGDLERSLTLDTHDLVDPAEAFDLEAKISEKLFGNSDFFFAIYEQNPVRTRMKFLDTTVPVRLKINRLKKEAVFYIGNGEMQLSPLRVTSREIVPRGFYQLIFAGSDVHVYGKFIYESSTGNIYSIPHSDKHPDFEKSTVWAIKIDQEEGGRE